MVFSFWVNQPLCAKIVLTMALFLGSMATPLSAETLPPPFSAQYSLYFKGIPTGEGTRSLTYLENGQFKFSSFAKVTGLAALFQQGDIEEFTRFEQIEGQLRPLEYVYQQNGRAPRNKRVLFDWTNQLAKSTYKEKTYELRLETGVLDSLLYQLIFMQDLVLGKQEFNYSVVDKDKIKVYTPKFIGREQIESGMGKLDTLKYERVSEDKERRTTFWCAPSLRYLPVRVEHLERGDVLSMVLESVQVLGK